MRLIMGSNVKRRTVMIILTENCNLACTYCYEHHKTKNVMSFETAKYILDKELSKKDGYEEIIVDLFGGEPFLEFELIKKIHSYIFSKDWGKKIMCCATTNGTLVHGEVKEWLKEHRDTMWVGLSLDGTKEMHDINRCNSYDQIDIDFFKNTYPGQPCKMTVSEQTLPKLSEGIFYFERIGIPFSANLAEGVDWSNDNNFKILQEQLEILVDYYIKNPDKPICEFLDIKLALLGTDTPRNTKFCGTGEQMICYDINGNYYPCQAFAPQTLGDTSSKFKNTTTEMFTNGYQDEMCMNCIAYPVCRTCYGANNLCRGDYRKRDINMCKFNKMCILASAYIKYHRYINRDIEELSTEELLELKGIKAIQQLEL